MGGSGERVDSHKFRYYTSNLITVLIVTLDIKMNDILGDREPPHPFQWEDESRDSQDDRSSLLQTSMDDRDDSSNSVGVGEASVSHHHH